MHGTLCTKIDVILICWGAGMITHFSPETSRELKRYVYVYSDPDTREPFYIGKGRGSRVFDHLADTSDSAKARRIAEIRARGKEPLLEILAHGLDEETALKVEAAAIDLIGIDALTNVQRGHHSALYGRIEVSELEARYSGRTISEFDFVDDILLVKINNTYRYGMDAFEVYEATRAAWHVNAERARQVRYAAAVRNGLVLDVYRITAWFPAGSTMLHDRTIDSDGTRLEFVGIRAEESVRDRYVGSSVSTLFSQGNQNPVRYVMGGKRCSCVKKASALLHAIQEDPEQRTWCARYSVYGSPSPDSHGLYTRISTMLKHLYECDMVPERYGEVYESIGDEEIYLKKASGHELDKLSAEQLVSIVAKLVRADHFDNGFLIRTAIAKGLLVHYLDAIMKRWNLLE